MYTAKISGTGHYVPEHVITNDYLSTLMDTNDEWITERTGIKERRWVEEGDGNTAATMGIKAARKAIEDISSSRPFHRIIISLDVESKYKRPSASIRQELLTYATPVQDSFMPLAWEMLLCKPACTSMCWSWLRSFKAHS